MWLCNLDILDMGAINVEKFGLKYSFTIKNDTLKTIETLSSSKIIEITSVSVVVKAP